jgi:hypothetical protein
LRDGVGVHLYRGFTGRTAGKEALIATPDTPVVVQGPTTGTLKSTTKTVYGASLYSARLSLASEPTTFLQTKQGTGVRFVFEDLTPGGLYNVGMNAIGAAGASNWSDDGTMRVV